MENAIKLRTKLQRGVICVGSAVTFRDPTVSEALAGVLDFIWVDAEHAPLSIESVMGHIMATKGTDAAPLVRVPWNDPVLIKPVLDAGAAGIIAPMVSSAEEARRFVAGCLYPPEGIRGFGPRRPSNYGQVGSEEFCKMANEAIFTIAQIEHIDAVDCIGEILSVPRLDSVLLGPNDLAGSMGHTGNPNHPEVLEAIDAVIAAARKNHVYVGTGVTDDPRSAEPLIKKGVNWLCIAPDYMLMLRSANYFAREIRRYSAA